MANSFVYKLSHRQSTGGRTISETKSSMTKAAVSPTSRNGAREAAEPSLGPLPYYVGYTLRRTQVAMFRDFARREPGLRVTPGQFSLLTLVAANPGISQGALARVHGLDKSTLSPAVDKLAQEGFIRRERTSADRRFYALSLTEEGARVLGRVTAMVEDQERAMAAAIGPADAASLIDMLRRVAEALDGGRSME
jgi:DNA-binding MarR family transcriptional regulator